MKFKVGDKVKFTEKAVEMYDSVIVLKDFHNFWETAKKNEYWIISSINCDDEIYLDGFYCSVEEDDLEFYIE